jgi:hypothetical protein
LLLSRAGGEILMPAGISVEILFSAEKSIGCF